ncbi:MAG: hypothetical protein RIQ33_2222 [Bacteroidota bacterium]|jgi:hypothetical protein
MKKITTLFVLVFASQFLMAEKVSENEVPKEVKARFSEMFPNSYVTQWEEEFGNYEAEFKLNKIGNSALFSPAGQWLQTETDIKIEVLPMAVFEYISKNIAGKKIAEAAKILDAKGVVTYEAEIAGEDYIFDAKGNFLRKQKA